jgi:hypothetical protein
MAHEVVAFDAFEDSMLGGHVGLFDVVGIFFLNYLGLPKFELIVRKNLIIDSEKVWRSSRR